MNKEELKKISELINKYSNDYNCRIELEEIETTIVGSFSPQYKYKITAKKEDIIEC